MALNPREMQPDVLSTVARQCVVKCKVGETLAVNDIIYFSGMDDAHPIAYKADASAAATCQSSLWICQEALSPTTAGAYTTAHVRALITGIDTSAAALVGSPVYLSDTAGQYSLTAGTVSIRVGEVIIKDASNGAILLMPQSVAGVAAEPDPPADSLILDWVWAPNLTESTNQKNNFEDIYTEAIQVPGVKRVILDPSDPNALGLPFTMSHVAADLDQFMFITKGSVSSYTLPGVVVTGTWATLPSWIRGPSSWSADSTVFTKYDADGTGLMFDQMLLTDGVYFSSSTECFFDIGAPAGDAGGGPTLELILDRNSFLVGQGEGGHKLIKLRGPITYGVEYGSGCGASGTLEDTDEDLDAIWNIKVRADAATEGLANASDFEVASTVYLTYGHNNLSTLEITCLNASPELIGENYLLYDHIFVNLLEINEKPIVLPNLGTNVNFQNARIKFSVLEADPMFPEQHVLFSVAGGGTINGETTKTIYAFDSIEFIAYLGDWYIRYYYISP